MVTDNLILKASFFCAILIQATAPELDFSIGDAVKNISAIGFLAVALNYSVKEIKRMRVAHEEERKDWRAEKAKEIQALNNRHIEELERTVSYFKEAGSFDKK